MTEKIFSGSDFLYIGLGLGALYFVLKNTKPLSGTITGAASVVNPLLAAAGKGAEIVTNSETWKLENSSYLYGLLKAPLSTEQSYRIWQNKGGFLGSSPFSAESINLAATALGLFK